MMAILPVAKQEIVNWFASWQYLASRWMDFPTPYTGCHLFASETHKGKATKAQTGSQQHSQHHTDLLVDPRTEPRHCIRAVGWEEHDHFLLVQHDCEFFFSLGIICWQESGGMQAHGSTALPNRGSAQHIEMMPWHSLDAGTSISANTSGPLLFQKSADFLVLRHREMSCPLCIYLGWDRI